MRFLPNGPAIPDELLIARDEGRVVLFCGAGVSRARAGLSGFFGLAKDVIDRLGVLSDSPARKLIEAAPRLEKEIGASGLISADRVFGLLERDFSTRDIEAAVAKALQPPQQADLSAHQTLLDLARWPDGKFRLVTTNFDLLFESCHPDLESHQPPRLPDPQRYDEFEGVVHLHGCVNGDYSGAAGEGFVLSSSGFGRAYLSDGWATRFIRSILDKYVVVFLGYTADDPPVQYLLEALNHSLGSRGGIYAFQAGTAGEAESRWRHKGVEPIIYEETENHRALWDTLEAWAARARDPDLWYEKTIALARRGPASLPPHKRGQVAHVVSTAEGARRFATSDKPPPAEWLCVFDPSVRFSSPGRPFSFKGELPYFDPFDTYGLDRDVRPPKPIDESASVALFSKKREIPDGAWDAFRATQLDRQNLGDEHFSTFRGASAMTPPRLPRRLGQLGVWLRRIAHQPAALWWAAGQAGLHPLVRELIRSGLESGEPPGSPEIGQGWRYVFEAWENRKEQPDLRWHRWKSSVDQSGWTEAAVRELGLIQRPYITVERPTGCVCPPEITGDLSRSDILRVDVKYPEHVDKFDIPDEHLLAVVRELRKILEHCVSLENELGGDGLAFSPSIEPDPDSSGNSKADGITRVLLLYVDLFKSLLAENLEAARQEYLSWWQDDETVFVRLRIWASGDPRVFSADEAGDLVSGLSDRVFWDRRHQRDLLITLVRRWAEYPQTDRSRLEQRLLAGPPPLKGEDDSKHIQRRARRALDRIHWLSSQGCEFDFDLEAESARLRQIVPEWRLQSAKRASASMEFRSGWVETETDYEALLTVPLAELVGKAAELSGRSENPFVEANPFAGLASDRPVRALAALRIGAERSGFQQWAWRTFLTVEARKSDRPKLSALIGERLARLTESAFTEIVDPVSDWLLACAPGLLQKFRATFDRVWNKVIAVAVADPDCAKSSIIRREDEADWANEALNSPVGNLARILLNDPQTEGLKARDGFPTAWLKRVEELLSLVGDLHRYSLVMFSRHVDWFFTIDPDWTSERLISVLPQGGDDAEAFWAGFFWASRLPSYPLYKLLKPWLLKGAKRHSLTSHQHSQSLAGMLLAGWASMDEDREERLVTNREMREVLVSANDVLRVAILWQLKRFSKDWADDQEQRMTSFLGEVWPRHLKAKSSEITAELLDLTIDAREDSCKVAETILPLLTKSDRISLWVHHLGTPQGDFVEKCPDTILSILSSILPDSPAQWPWELENFLDRISAANPALARDPRLIELRRRWNAR